MTRTLTDRSALLRNRRRAGRAPALFLHETAIDEVKDRLSFVNKSFTDTSIVTGLPEPWQAAFPDAQIVEDAETLVLEPESGDLILHAMSLHWADDPVGQLIQCRRALRPDGLIIAVFFGGQTLHQLRTVLAQAESDLRGGLSPRVLPMGDIRDLGALLQRAGFALPVADSLPLNTSYADPVALMHDLRAMGEANALDARLRRFTRRDVLMRAAQLYTEAFATPDGRIPATFELITLTGWAPSADQPQPLRPGSATSRLADALGTSETPLKD
ncbi:MAG: methyltransferase domain-containing protein [Roseovarius sp.]